MSEQDIITIEYMETYGGSFVKALAQAARHADATNLAKIKNTFADYWWHYTEMAQNGQA